mmetsp:Transcript_8505/g.18392  ORF Transcript_8505/g.18392 Transcript_8505/m.18392 type:complete len:179 (-) Transcript_8505:322-858(-)|eukprot:CAMPEP_0183734474 /NCGR_PEP_ID=MMETSP0737-20130205/43914_1 /TAXON_ID=385413 /ORGANISM="Thalassiosira miniscula, Strain CCMP1093" /LENGTH=178 /DNA_ID=CAMNT_0025967967 /DNA_START=38 /DNA_END=574 /DNA_ORIENTATION=+
MRSRSKGKGSLFPSFSNKKDGPIQRHGPGDGVITLNVGGQNFQTLRSTIAQNEVLRDHVQRAEGDVEKEVDGDPVVIFVDRDPKHFGTILEYLRNKADGVYIHPNVARRLLKLKDNNDSNNNSNSSENGEASNEALIAKSISATSFIQLPNDSKTLTELYFESIYYNIPELTDRICSE